MTSSKKRKPAQKRSYNNALRQKKSDGTREIIIAALVELLVERKGGVVTFEEIAEHCDISARSIYRLFKDRESLHLAMDQYLLGYLQSSDEKMALLDVKGFGRKAFELFDEHEKLMMAYLYSPFGQELRMLFRKKLNMAMTHKILEKRKIELSLDNKKKLAFIVSLINAKIWHDIKLDTGYSGHDMGPVIEWALETLINNLEEKI